MFGKVTTPGYSRFQVARFSPAAIGAVGGPPRPRPPNPKSSGAVSAAGAAPAAPGAPPAPRAPRPAPGTAPWIVWTTAPLASRISIVIFSAGFGSKYEIVAAPPPRTAPAAFTRSTPATLATAFP